MSSSALVAFVGCLAAPDPMTPAPVELSHSLSLCSESAAPTTHCRQPAEVEKWLRHPQLTIVAVQETPAGIQGARVLTLAVPSARGRTVFRAKWRAFSTTGRASEPRKELAAYHIQKLFLKPAEYVVPPTSGHCFPVREYRARVDTTEPSSFGLDCVYGVLSFWLEDVQSIQDAEIAGWFDGDGLLDEELFEKNRTYARSVAHVNLLTYLIQHADSHLNQFVISKAAELPRVYAVDNSMAFGVYRNTDLGDHDWSKLQVEAMPLDTLRRLHALDDNRNLEKLGVLEQYRHENGVLVWTPPSTAASLAEPLRWVGDELQIGLTRTEIELMRRHLADLPGQLVRKDITTF